MGEGARAAIWAEQNGMDISDMGGEEWAAFFEQDGDETEEEERRRRRARRTCPICCKRMKTRYGAEMHVGSVHEPHAATRDGWRQRIDAWRALA